MNRRDRRLVQALLIVSCLGLHLVTRIHTTRSQPLERFASYPEHYLPALALLGGHGFTGLALDPDDSRPEAREVETFLAGLMPRLDPARVGPYLRSAQKGPLDPVSASRILDIRIAALLWSFTGPSWPALLELYSVLTTLVSALVFFIATRLGGFWAGFAAALIVLGSPFENAYVVASVRDLSPYWFATLSMALVAATAAPRSSRPRLAWYLAAGATAGLGLGWRTDALLFPPFVGAVALARLLGERRKPRQVAAGLCAFVVGMSAVAGMIVTLGPGRLMRPGIGLHIAYYGNHARSNLLGIENPFQAVRDDGEAALQVSYFSEVSQHTAPDYGQPGYPEACRRLYLRTLAYEGYNWALGFPAFFVRALGGLSAEGELQGQTQAGRDRDRLKRLGWLYWLILDPLTRLSPALFLLGLAGLPWSRDPLLGAALAMLAVAYAAVWLLVLPENKHFGVMLSPLAVLAGFGISELPRWPSRFSALRARLSPPLAWTGAPRLLAALAGIAVLLFCLRTLAIAERQGYVDAVLAAARNGTEAWDAYRGSRFFSVSRPAGGGADDPVGYLLTVQAGRQPGNLTCRHFRGRPAQRLYQTRHSLRPLARQYFFVAALNGDRVGRGRPYVCTVTVEGDAQILKAERINLEDWSRPLLATVIVPGERRPGSPSLSGPGASTIHRGFRYREANEFGLLPEEQGLLSFSRAPENPPGH